MNYLSIPNAVQNNYMKTHSPYHIPSASQKSSYLNETESNLVESNGDNNNQIPSETCHKIQEVWSKRNFERSQHIFDSMKKVAVENIIHFNNVKTTWGTGDCDTGARLDCEIAGNDVDIEPVQEDSELQSKRVEKSQRRESSPDTDQKPLNLSMDKEENHSPSHHARRPPNAFLIFCKKHRPVVRQRFPNTENRGVTKILGEWWALLSAQEKQIYNDLAKEYKDAFLSANPNFRWYKLPAPPLRTLATRPIPATNPKVSTPLTSPTTVNPLPEFTPGKLADESQLGGLTSLMNNNFSCNTTSNNTPKIERETNNNNNNDNNNKSFESPIVTIQPSLPPRPIKKRIFELYSNDIKHLTEDKDLNLTNQDFFEKVVDGIFSKQINNNSPTQNNVKDKTEQQRKSDRVCKGKRYERFMAEGRLVGFKRESKFLNKLTKIEPETQKPEAPKLDLENTIKRLAERTNVKLDYDTLKKHDRDEILPTTLHERTRSISENNEDKRDRSTSESSDTSSKIPAPNFNLDLRIGDLPCLSYDEFLFRKKQSKKRKIKTKFDEEIRTKSQKIDGYTESSESQLVGSKKRKNKHSITHLNKSEENINRDDADLIGLATLAMVAASTEKIEENMVL